MKTSRVSKADRSVGSSVRTTDRTTDRSPGQRVEPGRQSGSSKPELTGCSDKLTSKKERTDDAAEENGGI